MVLLVLLCVASLACDDGVGPDSRTDLSAPWTTASATEVGLDTTVLKRALIHADAIPRFQTLLIARHGHMVMEQYLHGGTAGSLNDVRSVTKSVVGTLIGIALERHELASIDAPIARYLGASYHFDAIDSAITIRHLLTMSGGWRWPENTGTATAYGDWIASSDHVQYVLNQPHAAQPGSVFEYNSGAVHVLSVALEHAVGRSLTAYAQDVLFGPLGVDHVAWEPFRGEGVNGGSGIQLTAQDLLRFGQLYLQSGRSGDTQIVPEDWVKRVVTPAFTWREQDGPQAGVTYGSLWWIGDVPGARAYFAWGYGGQFVYVVPSLDLVVVATTNWSGSASEVGPGVLARQVLGVIVNDVLAAAGTAPMGGLTVSRMLPTMTGGWERPPALRILK